MQKRLQNQLYVGYPLGTLKNTIFDVKTSPRWTPKISDFFQKSSKNSTYHGLWSKMPLGSLQEPPKSLARAVQEPSRGVQEHQEAPCSLPRAVAFWIFSSKFRNATISTGSWPMSLELQLLSTNNKTPTTKEQCKHGGGPTRQRSWIYNHQSYILYNS